LTDDAVHHTWNISQRNSTQVVTMHYAFQANGDVSLNGNIGNDTVQMQLHPVEMRKFFPLLAK
jgi:hypothetical protein